MRRVKINIDYSDLSVRHAIIMRKICQSLKGAYNGKHLVIFRNVFFLQKVPGFGTEPYI